VSGAASRGAASTGGASAGGAAGATARLVERSVSVEVPATSANLGAGFDALAIALDIVNTVHVEAVEASARARVLVRVTGEGMDRLPTDASNRFVTVLEGVLRDAGLTDARPGWRIEMDNAIPVARGLGSSAAATVAALTAADALLGGGALTPERRLERAAASEGHADNAAAAILGGVAVVTMVEGRPRAIRVAPPPDLRAALFIPDRPLSTAAMRAALPVSVPFRDAVHNVGAAAMAVAALAGDRLDLLAPATIDRLHEPYRASVFPELPEMVLAAREAGALGACLSGAGSTIIAFCASDAEAARVAAAMSVRATSLGLDGRGVTARPRASGARVV
jgi:homoserine kinase